MASGLPGADIPRGHPNHNKGDIALLGHSWVEGKRISGEDIMCQVELA